MHWKELIPKGLSRQQAVEVWNYSKIGVLNTLFGICLYSALIYIGTNIYVAQIIGQIVGATFNYFTYSRRVFSSYDRSVKRYIGAYVINYLIGLVILYLIHYFIKSPYIAGFATMMTLAAINFFLLKNLAFRKQKS
jgi:putative flippase GtrA